MTITINPTLSDQGEGIILWLARLKHADKVTLASILESQYRSPGQTKMYLIGLSSIWGVVYKCARPIFKTTEIDWPTNYAVAENRKIPIVIYKYLSGFVIL
jgi:hypothetical protein